MRGHFWLKVILFSILPVMAFSSSTEQSYYYVAATDMSMSYLSNLFGTVGDVLVGGTSTPLISHVFYYFNKGVYIFTATLLTYIILTSVIATANEGKLLNDKLNTWIIIRSGLAIALLVPLTSGYCMMQVIVMSCVKQGIGLANSMWSEAVYSITSAGGFDHITGDTTANSQSNISDTPYDQLTIALGSNTSSYSKNTPVDGQASFMQLFRSSYCAYTVYQYDKAAAAENNHDAPLSANYGYFLLSDNTLCFGSKTVGATDTYNCQCGQYAFDDTDTLQQTSVITNMLTMADLMYGYAQSAYDQVAQNNPAPKKNLNTDGSSADMSQICQVLSSTNTNQGSCLPGVTVWTYAGDYLQYVSGYQSGQIDNADTGSDCPSWIADANTQGWIMAAAYYANLVQVDQNACSHNHQVSSLETFLPIASLNNGNNIITTCNAGSGACVNYPCMTAASGFSDSDLCNQNLLNSQVRSNWNALYNNDSNGTWQGMIQNMFADGNSNAKPMGIGYLADISTSAYYDNYTNPITGDTFDYYYNKMLETFLANFVLDIYEPDSLGYDILNNGSPSLIANGGMTLITKIIATVLGINVYPNKGPNKLFSYDNMTSGSPSTNGQCKTCYNDGKPDYRSSACYESGSSTSCIDGNGYGLFGMVAKEANGQVYVDPLSSISLLGRTILEFTLGFTTNLIDNIYVSLKDTVTNILASFISVALGLSALGFMGFLKGYYAPMFGPIIQFLVEILFKIHTTILFTYLPFAAALAVVFMAVGLLLGVYLPFLPFIMFTAGTISWFINVVEAMVAAPLVAMGVTHPKGHELLGKAEQALVLLLSVFLRPATMIIGFIAAIALSYAALYLLNLTFAYAFTIGLEHPSYTKSGYGTAVLGGLLYIIIYAYSCYAILSQTFSLIFQVPDKVMRWIGMPRDSTSQDAMAMVQGAKSGFTDAAGGAGRSGIQGSTQQARARAPDLSALSSLSWASTLTNKPQVKGGEARVRASDNPPEDDLPGNATDPNLRDNIQGRLDPQPPPDGIGPAEETKEGDE